LKIKLDFVSNSSSTSFVYISSEELSEKVFLEAAGVELDSPVADLFLQMHSEICNSLAYGQKLSSKEDVEGLTGTYDFTPEVIERMKAAIEQGENVITANLSSDGALAESVLCMEIFQIESEKFFINAFNNYW